MAEDEGVDNVDNFLDSELIEDHFTKEVSKTRFVQAFDDIAATLIRENLLLTALEFHTELVENGQELPRLRDFFSNPGNFERQAQERPDLSPALPRTSSVQTFDSLDFARYSDDGDKQVDERVAVLEFELRKAKETIKSLRANLTFATESESNVTDTKTFREVSDDAVKPHEKRALNFLINEYLLKQNYKLTSITFCDENEDQDFEDWDDVGLNIPKPPNLLTVYRDFTRYSHPGLSCHSVSSQVNMSLEDTKRQNIIRKELEDEITTLQEEIDNLNKVNSALHSQVKAWENIRLLSHSVSDENKNDDFVEIQHDIASSSQTRSTITSDKDEIDITEDITPLVQSTNENISTVQEDGKINVVATITQPIRKNLSEEFHTKLVDYCSVRRNFQDNRLAAEVADVALSSDKIVLMLGRCLPHIVPNVLLAKREELIPVILCTIALHPDDKQRDNLLNILFNLIKRPDDDQRQMILTGFVTLAQQLGPTTVETELLPQCWEQIAHKYVERRLLVIEASGVLAPYLPSEICSSLLLSMLQQMFEDKSDIVREAVTKNLALILTYICDDDKFSQTYRLLLRALEDSSENVVTAALHTLIPVFASWALELNKLQCEVYPNIFREVEEKAKCFTTCEPSIMPSAEERLFLTMISALRSLTPWLFLSVVQTGPFVDNLQSVDTYSPLNDRRFPTYHFPLEDLYVILGNREKVNHLVHAYDIYINQEWFETWSELEWLTNIFFPSLLSIMEQVPVVYFNSVHELVIFFHDLCTILGISYLRNKLKPLFQAALTSKKSDDLPLTSILVPLYVCGVLEILYKENNRKELSNFLQELIHTTAENQLPLDTIRTTFMELSSDTSLHELLIGLLWDNVTSQSSLIRACCARLFELLVRNVSESTLATRLAPALVTLANDPDITVRVATIPAFGAIMEVTSQRELMDKVRMQFISFLEDPQYQDHTAVLVEVIRTFGQTAPNADSKFREEFVLPHLVAIASQNAQTTEESKRLSIAIALLDAYTSLSYCFLNDQLITDLLLPGLRYLLADIQQVAPEQVEAIAVMINELSAKVEISRPSERSSNLYLNASAMAPSTMEDMKNKMSKIFIGATNQGRANIASIFQSRKK